jgi:hypothetical protein
MAAHISFMLVLFTLCATASCRTKDCSKVDSVEECATHMFPFLS